MANKSNKESCWMKFYYAATYVLAIVAILSLYLSIKSSNQTAESLNKTSDILNKVQHELSEFTEPVIGVEGYSWITDKDVGCSYPPSGIVVNYINLSNTPLVVKNMDFSVSYDNNKFESTSIKIGPLNKTYIVAPGKLFPESQYNKPEFQKYLKAKKGVMAPPFLQCQLTADIENISKSKKYKLKYVYQFGFDCSFPNTRAVIPQIQELILVSPPQK